MHSSAIHDARALATPSQIDASLARHKRLGKIAAEARPQSPAAVCQASPLKKLLGPPVFSMADWIERQRRIPLPTQKAEIRRIPRRVAVVDIQRAVAEHSNLPCNIMFCAARTAPVVRARQIAMFLAKTMTPSSFPEIGRRFGGRDHSTVHHAVGKMRERIEGDTSFAAEIEIIKTAIAARLA